MRVPGTVVGALLLSLGLMLPTGCRALLADSGLVPTPTPSATLGAPVSGTPPRPSSTPATPVPPNARLSAPEAKYRLIVQFGNIFYCDPDFYPVARVIDEKEFERRFGEIEKDAEEYRAILGHLGLTGTASLTGDQKRQVYAEHKLLNAIRLDPINGGYHFGLRISEDKVRGFAIEGLINQNGKIEVTKKEATIATCPICLDGTTRIATPSGDALVRDLQVGMSVWTADRGGVRRPAVILQVDQHPVARDILLVHLVLSDGRTLTASAGHPTIDGRVLGDLAIGDILDGAYVVKSESVPTNDGATYDLLPSGESGAYWANGILMKSTLAP